MVRVLTQVIDTMNKQADVDPGEDKNVGWTLGHLNALLLECRISILCRPEVRTSNQSLVSCRS